MKREDREYLRYIRLKACAVCGYIPEGGYTRVVKGVKKFYPYQNAAHHVGDGVSMARNDDTNAVPLCDYPMVSGPGTKNCHHKRAHHGNEAKRLRVFLRELAKEYREVYERLFNTETDK